MTFTYDEDLTAFKDQVRFLVGDIDEEAAGVSDEGIAFFGDLEGNRLYETAADVAEAIASRFAKSVQKSVGSMSLAAQQKYEHYRQVAMDLREKSELLMNASPLVGGISIADKAIQEQDEDRTVPAFTKTQFDIPSTQPMRGGRSGNPFGEF